jgi:hypothetical protein
VPTREALVAEQPREEHHAVGDEARHRAIILPPARDEERGDDACVEQQGQAHRVQDPLHPG